MHVRWSRRQHGQPWSPGPATLIAVAVVAFGSAFGVARAAGGGESSGAPASAEPRPVALRTASALPAMNAPPGPTEAELAAQREAREQARKRRLEKKREAAEERAAREKRQRLRAERRAKRAAEREAEAEAEARRQAAAERKARERERQQDENAAPEQPEPTTPEPPPPTTTTPVGEPFDDSG
jgi:cell division protein FtsN